MLLLQSGLKRGGKLKTTHISNLPKTLLFIRCLSRINIYIYIFQNVAQPGFLAGSSLAAWLSLASLATLSILLYTPLILKVVVCSSIAHSKMILLIQLLVIQEES